MTERSNHYFTHLMGMKQYSSPYVWLNLSYSIVVIACHSRLFNCDPVSFSFVIVSRCHMLVITDVKE